MGAGVADLAGNGTPERPHSVRGGRSSASRWRHGCSRAIMWERGRYGGYSGPANTISGNG